MDDQHEPPPDDEDRVEDRAAAAIRRLDAISRRARQPSVEGVTYDKVMQLEATVRHLTEVVGALAQTVSRLADQRVDESTMTTTELVERATREVDAMLRREDMDND